MISVLRKKGLRSIHPLLKRLVNLYLSRPRNYKHKGFVIKVLPGIFHPGLFFSTKIFIEFLETIELKNKEVLELGAGSGLMALFCAQKQAVVTASDINPIAIEGIKQNARTNKQNIEAVVSDLFDDLLANKFEVILINPPYYPRTPKKMNEHAWFCGHEFEYFHKLFRQLGEISSTKFAAFMILSEDCQMEKILSIAKENNLVNEQVYSKRIMMEHNYIFKITHKIH